MPLECEPLNLDIESQSSPGPTNSARNYLHFEFFMRWLWMCIGKSYASSSRPPLHSNNIVSLEISDFQLGREKRRERMFLLSLERKENNFLKSNRGITIIFGGRCRRAVEVARGWREGFSSSKTLEGPFKIRCSPCCKGMITTLTRWIDLYHSLPESLVSDS